MRVAFFTDTFTPQVNGVAKTLQRFVNYLDDQDVEYIVFAPGGDHQTLNMEQIKGFKSVPFYLYPECRLSLPNLSTIRKQLESFQPDLIHIATPFNIGFAGLYYGKKLGIPMVGSYHTNFDRYLEYYDLNILSKWVWKYMRWFHAPFRQTFVPSEETKRDLIQRGFRNISIWSRGVDCQLFHPNYDHRVVREMYHIDEPYILTYVGRLAPEKDLDVFLKIADSLPPSLKEQVHWLVAGDGPMDSELKAAAPKNMTFTGYVEGEHLARIYATSTLMVFPSRTETFGNVVLESMAAGTPVIGARAGGVQGIITQDETGKLCTPGHVDEFIEAITDLLCREKVVKEMGVRARLYAKGCSWTSIFEDLLLQYEMAIDDTIMSYA
ncbi:glycosyl transferase [Pontibacillus chungwhensis BH030062]|uniref:Glycosyl transferase n=1 Tax=Pontibacillus chungwhensis BH030062 TaxID=1385513 RepID=A0A0A2VG41_9BACI|nr:glycosyltransferase family 1 protein [Pontibacillus chungwhensis]KGP92600.1 glycosyl transferase [Pontibacillus chungwhensis BH030062]